MKNIVYSFFLIISIMLVVFQIQRYGYLKSMDITIVGTKERCLSQYDIGLRLEKSSYELNNLNLTYLANKKSKNAISLYKLIMEECDNEFYDKSKLRIISLTN